MNNNPCSDHTEMPVAYLETTQHIKDGCNYLGWVNIPLETKFAVLFQDHH